MIAFDSRHDENQLDPDTERMTRVAAGDREAFDELVRGNFDSTVRIIISMMGSRSDAEDIAQEVFLRVYRSRHRYLPTAKFSTYLGTIIRNTVLNAKRSLARRRVRLTEFVDEVPNPDVGGTTAAPWKECDLADQIDRKESVAVINQAISLLPRRQRTAIELVHFHGCTYVTAAERMMTSRKAIKSLLGRGRRTLSETFRNDGRF